MVMHACTCCLTGPGGGRSHTGSSHGSLFDKGGSTMLWQLLCNAMVSSRHRISFDGHNTVRISGAHVQCKICHSDMPRRQDSREVLPVLVSRLFRSIWKRIMGIHPVRLFLNRPRFLPRSLSRSRVQPPARTIATWVTHLIVL